MRCRARATKGAGTDCGAAVRKGLNYSDLKRTQRQLRFNPSQVSLCKMPVGFVKENESRAAHLQNLPAMLCGFVCDCRKVCSTTMLDKNTRSIDSVLGSPILSYPMPRTPKWRPLDLVSAGTTPGSPSGSLTPGKASVMPIGLLGSAPTFEWKQS